MSTTRLPGQTVVGVFADPDDAEGALTALRAADFASEQVSVVAKDTQTSRDMVASTEMGADAGAGAGTGVVLGGLTGGVIGWLVGIGALAIPGIGPVVAAGVLATTLGGAAIGAAAGGLIGALVGLGVSEEDARGYEERVREGRILLTVAATSAAQAEAARAIFEQHGGGQVRAYDRPPAT